MEEGRDAGKLLMKREIKLGRKRIFAKYLDGLEKSDLRDLGKPHKASANHNKRLTLLKQARREVSRKKLVVKNGVQERAKSLKKTDGGKNCA